MTIQAPLQDVRHDNIRGHVWKLKNSYIEMETQSLAGMIGPVTVHLEDRSVSPFAVAPWAKESHTAQLPGILRALRGEWVCVPFGRPVNPDSLPKEWQSDSLALGHSLAPEWPHGFGAGNHWHVQEQGPDWISLIIDYPEDSPVARLTRKIALNSSYAAIDFTLEVAVRRQCKLPIGLHPTLALPNRPEVCELRVGTFRSGRTYPIQFEGSSLLKVNTSFLSLHAVPTESGTVNDMTRLPFKQNREELVQLYDLDGRIDLLNHLDGYITSVVWNPADFPACTLWFSNRGRHHAPWRGRHLALGIEPTSSFFDLNPSALSCDVMQERFSNTRLLQEFHPNIPWKTSYQISFRELA